MAFKALLAVLVALWFACSASGQAYDFDNFDYEAIWERSTEQVTTDCTGITLSFLTTPGPECLLGPIDDPIDLYPCNYTIVARNGNLLATNCTLFVTALDVELDIDYEVRLEGLDAELTTDDQGRAVITGIVLVKSDDIELGPRNVTLTILSGDGDEFNIFTEQFVEFDECPFIEMIIDLTDESSFIPLSELADGEALAYYQQRFEEDDNAQEFTDGDTHVAIPHPVTGKIVFGFFGDDFEDQPGQVLVVITEISGSGVGNGKCPARDMIGSLSFDQVNSTGVYVDTKLDARFQELVKCPLHPCRGIARVWQLQVYTCEGTNLVFSGPFIVSGPPDHGVFIKLNPDEEDSLAESLQLQYVLLTQCEHIAVIDGECTTSLVLGGKPADETLTNVELNSGIVLYTVDDTTPNAPDGGVLCQEPGKVAVRIECSPSHPGKIDNHYTSCVGEKGSSATKTIGNKRKRAMLEIDGIEETEASLVFDSPTCDIGKPVCYDLTLAISQGSNYVLPANVPCPDAVIKTGAGSSVHCDDVVKVCGRGRQPITCSCVGPDLVNFSTRDVEAAAVAINVQFLNIPTGFTGNVGAFRSRACPPETEIIAPSGSTVFVFTFQQMATLTP